MTRPPRIRAAGPWQDQRGTTLVELAVVTPLFLLLLLGIIDFGRMGAEYVMAEKAVQLAARRAAVRPPACAGVPERHLRGAVPAGTVPPRFGTMCAAGASVCTDPGEIACAGDIANPTVAEIWGQVAPLLPTTATPASLRFGYAYNPALGFLGGPYTPMVTVSIQNLNFTYTSPLGLLAALSGGDGTGLPGNSAYSVPFPALSVSLPAEDLASGEAG